MRCVAQHHKPIQTRIEYHIDRQKLQMQRCAHKLEAAAVVPLTLLAPMAANIGISHFVVTRAIDAQDFVQHHAIPEIIGLTQGGIIVNIAMTLLLGLRVGVIMPELYAISSARAEQSAAEACRIGRALVLLEKSYRQSQ